MSLRTASDISAEYTAVRTAYLKAVDAESYSISEGGGSRSVQRANIEALRSQMLALESEYTRKTNGGIKIMGVTPV